MPKAKPISLHPLSFEEAISALMRVVPADKPKKRRRKLKIKSKKST